MDGRHEPFGPLAPNGRERHLSIPDEVSSSEVEDGTRNEVANSDSGYVRHFLGLLVLHHVVHLDSRGWSRANTDFLPLLPNSSVSCCCAFVVVPQTDR